MTAARINLLPHREERRKAARQHFFVIAGGTALLGAVVCLAGPALRLSVHGV